MAGRELFAELEDHSSVPFQLTDILFYRQAVSKQG
jgi:hypothetical protein